MTTYEFGEVVLVDFPQAGTTARKKRPALVVLDIGDADVVLAPITTRRPRRPGRLCTAGDWAASGLLRTSWVRLAKLACLDKRDISRRFGRVTERDKDLLRSLWHTVYTL